MINAGSLSQIKIYKKIKKKSSIFSGKNGFCHKIIKAVRKTRHVSDISNTLKKVQLRIVIDVKSLVSDNTDSVLNT